MANWTEPKDIAKKLEDHWEKGRILHHCLEADDLFPMTMKLKIPTEEEMAAAFPEVIHWISRLKKKGKAEMGYGYGLREKETNYRMIGRNSIPTHGIISSVADAISILGKEKEVEQFQQISGVLLEKWPLLQPWVWQYPFKVLEGIGGNLSKFLAVLEWFEAYPHHDLYLRQLDIRGVDTKFIEQNKSILSQLLQCILPKEQVYLEGKTFEEKFFLKEKPKMVRFRILDPEKAVEGFGDMMVPVEAFAQWHGQVSRVFMTENEINFLSFPQVQDACILFGQGYGVELLQQVPWLQEKEVYYWGDIDTHGFQILSIARGFLPRLQSFLMTEEILLAHEGLWGFEEKPQLAEIGRLTAAESALVFKLQTNVFGTGVRMEQERIAFHYIHDFLETLKEEAL